MKPEEGYVLADVLVDGQSQGAVSSYTFENITTAHKIVAIFTKFDENSVTIKTVTGAEKEIYCGDNGIDYDKYMYHMLMDIHDRLQE